MEDFNPIQLLDMDPIAAHQRISLMEADPATKQAWHFIVGKHAVQLGRFQKRHVLGWGPEEECIWELGGLEQLFDVYGYFKKERKPKQQVLLHFPSNPRFNVETERILRVGEKFIYQRRSFGQDYKMLALITAKRGEWLVLLAQDETMELPSFGNHEVLASQLHDPIWSILNQIPNFGTVNVDDFPAEDYRNHHLRTSWSGSESPRDQGCSY